MNHQPIASSLLALLSLAILPTSAIAQSIIPAADGTGTQIHINGQRYDIHGGSLSGDGANLFHSFQEFGLSTNEIANFLANPQLQNILGRVTGGNASLIDGLIQVSGGSPNLYLMNPAGMVFGSNASLNVPASFTATTADRIGFGNGQWFNALGSNQFSPLTGTPNQFVFTAAQPGSLVNAGNLAVPTGQNLMLLGGSVINTGNLSAPGGNLSVAAIPGESLVRISQAGMLLNLEIEPLATSGNIAPPSSSPSPSSPPSPLSLPELLTQANAHHATGVTVAADGTLRLTGSNLTLPSDPSTTLISGNLDVSAPPPSSPPLPPVAGSINLLGDQVGLINAHIDASGPNGGGDIRIGGDYQGSGPVPNAQRTFVSPDSTIRADALESGDGGRVIVWADDTTRFYGDISARSGSIAGDGGFVEVSGEKYLSFNGTADLTATNGDIGTLLLDPENIVISSTDPDTAGVVAALPDIFATDFLGQQITINAATLESLTADIFLEATNDIIFNAPLNIATPKVRLTAQAGNDIIANFDIITIGGDVSLTADADLNGTGDIILGANIGTSNTAGNAGSITLKAGGDIQTNRLIAISTTLTPGKGRNVSLEAGGEITVSGNIAAFSETDDGGNVELKAKGNITFQNCFLGFICIETFGGDGIGIPDVNSGDITLISEQGGIDLRSGNLSSSTAGLGRPGNIFVQAKNDIKTHGLITRGEFSNAQPSGNIFVESLMGSIDTRSGQLDLNSSNSNSGIATLKAQGDIRTGSIRIDGKLNGGELFLESKSGDVITQSILATGKENGGNISINSNQGKVDTSAGSINAAGGINGGNITITAKDDVSTGNIVTFFSGFNGNSGNITIQSTTASIDTTAGDLITASALGKGGDITLDAANRIDAGQISALALSKGQQGGKIDMKVGNLITLHGDIDTNRNTISFNGPVQLANDVAIEAADSGNLFFNGTVDGTQSLQLRTVEGTVQFGDRVGSNAALSDLRIEGTATASGPAGIDITTVNDLVTQNLRSEAGITLKSTDGNIRTDALDTSSAGQQAGFVTLSAPIDIQVQTINSQNTQDGNGGEVDITVGQFFRATGTFQDRNGINASISSAAQGDKGGTIIIRHGGNGQIPFIVGDASVNGTAGAITRGNETPEQTIFPDQEYLYTHRQDNNQLQIISVDPFQVPGPKDFIYDPDAACKGIFASNDLGCPTNKAPSYLSPGQQRLQDLMGDNELENLAQLVGDIIGADTQIENEGGTYNFAWSVPKGPSFTLEVDAPPVVSPTQVSQAVPRTWQPPNLTTLFLDALGQLNLEEAVTFADQLLEAEFEQQAGEDLTQKIVTVENLRETLRGIEAQTGKRAVIIYALAFRFDSSEVPAENEGHLELLLVMPEGPPIAKTVPEAKSSDLERKLKLFRTTVQDASTEYYLPASKQLYDWLIRPLEGQLEELEIDTLIFAMNGGLRLLPLAALHDGEQFLVEKYSLGSVPSVSLTDTSYRSVQETQALAMGASEFPGTALQPLPAVPVELAAVSDTLWQGEDFLNQAFTLSNLRQMRQRYPFEIVHLATHASFQFDQNSSPFIQLWDGRMDLDDMRKLQWYNQSMVELLVLSACETAVGDYANELGFAGLAVRAGVKSALASLWQVSDTGTLALMTEFYHHLGEEDVTIKAEALRRAQLAMIRGEARIENGQLVGNWGAVPLPANLTRNGDRFLSHPYFWSGFATIGSPW